MGIIPSLRTTARPIPQLYWQLYVRLAEAVMVVHEALLKDVCAFRLHFGVLGTLCAD